MAAAALSLAGSIMSSSTLLSVSVTRAALSSSASLSATASLNVSTTLNYLASPTSLPATETGTTTYGLASATSAPPAVPAITTPSCSGNQSCPNQGSGLPYNVFSNTTYVDFCKTWDLNNVAESIVNFIAISATQGLGSLTGNYSVNGTMLPTNLGAFKPWRRDVNITDIPTEQRATTNIKTPPPKADDWTGYGVLFHFEPEQGKRNADCLVDCPTAYFNLANDGCGNLGGEANGMAPKAKLNAGCGTYYYEIYSPKGPPPGECPAARNSY